MADNISKETKGAWVIHHGRKVSLDADGAAEFPVIDEISKSANLLSRLGGTDKSSLTNEEVTAVAKAARLNPRLELPGLLSSLEERRLIERTNSGVNVLGITTRGALIHAADMFDQANPTRHEVASIDLAEKSSEAPVPRVEVAEYISDTHKITRRDTDDFLDRAQNIGFVDFEGEGESRLLFNGNLFRRDSVAKASKILDSLTSEEEAKVQEFGQILHSQGCVAASEAEQVLGVKLFEKLNAAAVYDLNTVSNDGGEHVFVTTPGAFHKFVNPMVDDCFDHAKALVSALTYGRTMRQSVEGRIYAVELLLQKLNSGGTVGPAPAIGKDYRVLEKNRVVKITMMGSKFYMKLLKREVGELALQVLVRGDGNTAAIATLHGAPMNEYSGPEASRERVRKKQNQPSKRATQDILGALRSGGTI